MSDLLNDARQLRQKMYNLEVLLEIEKGGQRRTWFSGKLFAIRRWSLPAPAEVVRRAAALPPSRFYDFAAPLRVDDILLCRLALAAGGPGALRETDRGLVEYRAPETLRVYMGHLRHKLEDEPASPRYLLTEVGVGYRLATD